MVKQAWQLAEDHTLQPSTIRSLLLGLERSVDLGKVKIYSEIRHVRPPYQYVPMYNATDKTSGLERFTPHMSIRGPRRRDRQYDCRTVWGMWQVWVPVAFPLRIALRLSPGKKTSVSSFCRFPGRASGPLIHLNT